MAISINIVLNYSIVLKYTGLDAGGVEKCTITPPPRWTDDATLLRFVIVVVVVVVILQFVRRPLQRNSSLHAARAADAFHGLPVHPHSSLDAEADQQQQQQQQSAAAAEAAIDEGGRRSTPNSP